MAWSGQGGRERRNLKMEIWEKGREKRGKMCIVIRLLGGDARARCRMKDAGLTCHWYKINFEPMGDWPCCFLAPPVFGRLLFIFVSVGCVRLSRLCFGREGEGGGRGKRGRREVAWRGAVVAASSAPPVVAYDSRAPTSAAPGFSPPCVCEGARARGKLPMAAARR